MRRLIIATFFALSCSHTRPEEMTVERHLAEARAHEEYARRQEQRYNPGLDVVIPGSARTYGETDQDVRWSFNPTKERLDTADREMRSAAEHLAAARQLETFESNACKDIPPAERSACPLLASWVTQVRDTKTGIELQLKPTIDAPDTHRRLTCHLAYAQANGFERPSCPLFINGIKISLRDRGVLVFTGETPVIAKELQDQARRIFAPETIPAAAVSHNP
jgi:hypothetical protein